MVEKAKKRLPILLTVVLAVLVALSGISMLGIEHAQATASGKVAAQSGDGLEEQVEGAAAYGSPTGTTSGLKYWDFGYTGGIQSLTGIAKGTYKLEVWGAAGGADAAGAGGKGGYSVGAYTVAADNSTIYVVVGNVGASSACGVGGGYNGGGHAGNTGSSGAGGGATHMATMTGVLSALSSRKDTILLVAGGGGGGGNSVAPIPGAAGGGTSGIAALGGGGTQSAGGSGTNAGTFGQGGHRIGDGGGGGGGYWGGGAATGDGGGGGGSGYIGGVTNFTGGTNVTARTVAGNAALPVTTVGSTATETGHAGAGYARITQLNSAPIQNSIPTITIYRNQATTVNVTTSIGVTDANSGDVVKLRTAGIYMTAATSTPANGTTTNSWLNYSMSVGAQTFTVTAKQWWSGTKDFYINLRDDNSAGTILGSNVWVTLRLKVAEGAYTALSKTTGTDVSGTVKYKFGLSNTNIATEAKTSTKVFNPLGTNRQTLWIDDALRIDQNTTFDISSLYSTTVAYDKMAFPTTPTLTYVTNRYSSTSAGQATAQAISSAGISGATNSSYFTNVTFEGSVTTTYYNGSAYTTNSQRGKSTITLKSRGMPAGAYYYVITVSVIQVCSLGGETERTVTFDIVYRVDNTRPTLTNELHKTLTPGDAPTAVNISDFCSDQDGNNLTIADVIVPTNELALVDQYGKLATVAASTNYNIGVPAGATNYNAAVTTGTTDSKTGFSNTIVYKAAGGDATFNSTQSQGNVNTAYLGYYINTAETVNGVSYAARTRIYLEANKASRNSYTTTTKRDGQPRDGHFYILVRIIDAGDPSDGGIWFPIAITVRSAAPVTAGAPSVSGAAGTTHYFTPFGVRDESFNYYGIGSTNLADDDLANNTLGVDGGSYNDASGKTIGKVVKPFAFDSDNYSVGVSAGRTVSLSGGRTATLAASTQDSSNVYIRSTYSQREGVFLAPEAGDGTTNFTRSTRNVDIISAIEQNNSSITNVNDGFKEFFTISRVKLYARTSILLGFTDKEISDLESDGIIKFKNIGNTNYVEFEGLAITLNKYTMGAYLKVSVDVVDTHNTLGTVAIAVNVTDATFNETVSSRVNKGKDQPANQKTFNTLGGIALRDTNYEPVVVYEYTLQVGDVVRISPYDLFFDPDTYRANIFKPNSDELTAFNTNPDSAGHSDFMRGVSKKIAVIQGATAAEAIANTAVTSNFGLKQLTIATVNQRPQISGGVYGNTEESSTAYGFVNYVPAVTDASGYITCSEHFVVTANQKTPSSGFISFKYVVTDSAGETATVEIHIKVANSLPHLRNADTLVKLSATPNMGNSIGNSSLDESNLEGTNRLDHFIINDNTYNVREYVLNDLFVDPDAGDSVKFSTRTGHMSIVVGTMSPDGTFIPLGADNVYVNVYRGAGTNNRAGYNNCLIIQGLSSTQGVAGGIWIQLYVMDDAIGTVDDAVAYIQIEVYNSIPEYAELTGDNAMENTAPEGAVNPKYVWRGESDTTTAIVAKLFNPTPKDDGSLDCKVYPYSTSSSVTAVTSVEKPLYIASNEKVMEYYKNAVNTALLNQPDTGGAHEYSYSPSQVRYIAKDYDGAQGLVLHTGAYNAGGAAEFPKICELDESSSNQIMGNSAVAVNDFYGNGFAYIEAQRIVDIIFFNEDGSVINGSDSVDAAEKANTTTNWIIAFNFVALPTREVKVRIRLRDGNLVVNMPAGAQESTSGGYSYTKLYSGKRTVENGQFVPKVSVNNTENLYNGNGLFSFSIKIRSQGIYDNMTRFATTAVDKDGVSMNNVWSAKDSDGNVHYYSEENDYILDEKTHLPTNVFRYEGITIASSSTTTTTIPISYFSFVSNNAASPTASRGTGQRYAAYYDVDKFKTAEPADIMSAFTLTDGYRTWTDEDLYNGNCPYIKIGVTDDMQGKDSSTYLTGQQRFAVLGSTKDYTLIPTHDEVLGDFIEDQYGIVITKNKVRSVGELKLSIRMQQWQSEDGTTWTKSTDYDPITVTVPITVANTALNIDKGDDNTETGREYNIATNTSEGYTVMLTTNLAADKVAYADRINAGNFSLISSSSADDQATFTYTSAGNATLTATYREDTYFLANSLGVNFTSEQLDYIAGRVRYSGALNVNASGRVGKYFGVGSVSGVNSIQDAFATENGATVLKAAVKESINHSYSNYFTVSPTSTDSKSITITPIRITTFDYSKDAYEAYKTENSVSGAYDVSEHRAWIISQAATRGLKVDFDGTASVTVTRIYYPLRLMVYDRLSVGVASNTTTFTQSSFDVITINVEVQNSAPKILTRNLNRTINVGGTVSSSGTVSGGKNYPGRIISLATGQSVNYSLSELVSDADMVFDTGFNRYQKEAEVKAGSQITRDTGDYLYPWNDRGELVKVDYLDVPKSQNLEKNKTAVTYNIDPESDTLQISVNERLDGYNNDDVAAYLKLTFADRYYNATAEHPTMCEAVIEVHIANAAPWLSDEAKVTRNIVMKTGEYFTLYTTSWKDFFTGVGKSSTFRDVVGENTYVGTYFDDMAEDNSSYNSKNIAGVDGQKDSWEFGPDTKNIRIKQPNNNYTPTVKGSKTNLGYMAIASDDAPWTLRIDDKAIGDGVYVSSNGSRMIGVTKLNSARFENSSTMGYTAVMFEALGACEDVTVTVTLIDGTGSSALGVAYTFKITVESTIPEAITMYTEGYTTESGAQVPGTATSHKLGGTSLTEKGGQAKYAGRLTHNRALQMSEHIVNAYDIKMKVGEKISLKTSDFAFDNDLDDVEVMYLLGRSGSDPFTITAAGETAGIVTNYSPYISLEYKSGSDRTSRNTMFTIEALNFHNEASGNIDNLYDTVKFYICDPYGSTAAQAIEIELRVHVYPSDVTERTDTNTQSIIVDGVSKTSTAGAYAVKLVTKPGEGGIVEDNDAGASRTRYSVKVYSLLYYTGEGDNVSIAAYTNESFGRLQEAEKNKQIIASYTIGSVADIPVPVTFETQNSMATNEFISAISFAQDGSVMYVMPRKATNGASFIHGADGNREGFQLYVEVEKFVDRLASSGLNDYFDSAAQSYDYKADAMVSVRIANSAPVAVEASDANRNVRGDNNSYFFVTGTRGDKEGWDFLLYNEVDSAVALFRDPDGDSITYKGIDVIDVYTLEDGTATSHLNKPGVKESAEDAIILTTKQAEYIRPGETKVQGKFNAVNIAVKHKIDIEGHGGEIIYVRLAVTVYDTTSSSTATREIVVGIRNSAPTFKSEEEINSRYKTKLNSYTTDGTDATLTLTITNDRNDNLIEQNENGWVEVSLMDLISDFDYNENDSMYKETFSFVDPENMTGRVGLGKLSGDANHRMWLENGSGDIANTVAEAEKRRFNIRTTADNMTLLFKTNSFERGASDSVVLRVSDSSGATTGTLTIKLVIGNSRPVDLTQGNEELKDIYIKGGSKVPDGLDAFEATTYSLLNFVSDPNPSDMKDYSVSGLPAQPITFLTVTGVTARKIDWHESATYDKNDPPSIMVTFIAYEQRFSIAPIEKYYGTQEFDITISDSGNADTQDSFAITVTIRVHITPNPTEAEVYPFNVYWCRELPITAKALFDNPKSDGDESAGFIITDLEIIDNPDNAIRVIHADDSDVWSIRGDVRDRTVTGRVQVEVNDGTGNKYWVPIVINVADNQKPELRAPFNIENGTVLIEKNEIDDNGIYIVNITRMFTDPEGDELTLVSAKTVKSSLIGVTADKANNQLRFRFKGRGETKVEVKVADAVSTYTYTFVIGTDDLPAPNFFIGVISRVQSNPWLFIIIAAAILLLLIILIIIIAAVRKKKKMREEIEALLVSEMELEEQMLKLAAGPSPVNYQAYGYLPPTPGGAPQQPGMMLGSGTGAPDPNAAIGLNPGSPQPTQGAAPNSQQLPPPAQNPNDGFGDDDL